MDVSKMKETIVSLCIENMDLRAEKEELQANSSYWYEQFKKLEKDADDLKLKLDKAVMTIE